MNTSPITGDTVELGDDPVDLNGLVDIDGLVCPGCWGPVVDAPPSGWPARAGRVPQFSHPDGSVLCPDECGRVGEPVEAGGLRYGLTDTGAEASLDEAGGWVR